MHTNNIELLRDEAQRLLQLNVEGLEQMMAAKGVITEAKEGSQQTFDRTSTPKYIEVLKGELTKLENMELVIAVVGTMKAGKSTTINAIVGTEVLPNRNRPMTALPTLIRHTPGQIEPILKFENNEPINVLFESIRQHIATGKVNDVLKSLSDDSDMKELIGNITSEQNFGQHYQGATNIFWCLKTLNDLVRLSNELHVPFPFSSYSNIGQMPVITVEFAHLREAGKTHGQLTLLDTPGPNESGQDHLRDMLTEQLKKTSAVLAVFDYTQLKSDADEQVRNEIKSIAQLHKGRLFALVNKFDQKDRNGDGKEAVQALVADKLMDGLLDRKHVFPVSSKWGYLANRARHEIAIHHGLPNAKESSWVVDFAEEAFGRRWESKISDNEEVIKSANALWEDSGFHEPMENVIRAAHTKAALLSIDSAAEKLVKCTNDVENFLGARRGALSQSVESLQQRISDLKGDIEIIERMENAVKEDIESTFSTLNKKSSKMVVEARNIIKNELDSYFKEGKKIEKAEIDAKRQEIIKQQEESKRKAPFGWGSDFYFSDLLRDIEKQVRDFDPDRNPITYGDKKKADDLLGKIKKMVDESIDTQRNNMDGNVKIALEKFRDDFDRVAESANKIITGINSSMAKDGFKVSLKIPNANKLDAVLRNSGLSLNDKLNHKTKTESYSVKKDGWWSGFKNWCNNDWGRETKTRQVDEYVVDMDHIRKFINDGVDKLFATYSVAMRDEITNPLRFEVDIFFMELRKILENIRGNLQQGIRDQQSDKAELDVLSGYLDKFLSNIFDVTKDCEALNHDVDYLKSVKVAA